MRYFYNFAVLPQDKLLLLRIDQAAERLAIKLQSLDLIKLGISEYNQRYLGSYIQNIRGILQINTYLLAWALDNSQLPVEKCVLVDYGGGPGLLTFLAKELGLRKVIYNDIYDVSCQDAEKVGKAIGNEAQAYVQGDIDQLITYVSQKGISIDAIASYDVIEHIYDIEGYFRKIKNIPHRSLKVVLASSANFHNPLIKKDRMKRQIEDEHKDRYSEWGHKQRDSLQSFLNLRKEIIRNYAPTIPAEMIDQLAVNTRGLYKHDIEKCIDEYTTRGKIAYRPDHPTNTCDPLTGNWSEHLMDTRWIKKVFQQEGFEVTIKSGFYAYTSNRVIRYIKYGLNYLISFLRPGDLWISSYYVLYAVTFGKQ